MPLFYPLSVSLHGIVVATLLFTALFSSLVSGPLSDRYSRITVMGIGSAIFSMGSLIAASAHNLGMFLLGRALAGVGEGLFLSPAGVWLAESSPKEVGLVYPSRSGSSRKILLVHIVDQFAETWNARWYAGIGHRGELCSGLDDPSTCLFLS